MKAILVFLVCVSGLLHAQGVVELNDGTRYEEAWILDFDLKTVTFGVREKFLDGPLRLPRTRVNVVKVAHDKLRSQDIEKLQPKLEELRRKLNAMEQAKAEREKRQRESTLETRGGIKYLGVTDFKINGDTVTVYHAGGMAKLALADIDQADVQRFSGSLSTAKAVEAEVIKSRGKTEAEAAEKDVRTQLRHALAGTVTAVTKTGVLIIRSTVRNDITQDVPALVEVVMNKKVGETWSGNVVRNGFWTDESGVTYPRYLISKGPSR